MELLDRAMWIPGNEQEEKPARVCSVPDGKKAEALHLGSE